MTETIELHVLGAPPPDDILLDVRTLRTIFHVMDGDVPAVDGVSFQIRPGRSIGIVGESGSCKSGTDLTIMRLLGIPPASYDAVCVSWLDRYVFMTMYVGVKTQLRGQ